MRFKIRILDILNENIIAQPKITQQEQAPYLTTSITNKQRVKKLKGIKKLQRMELALKNSHIFEHQNQDSIEKLQDNANKIQDQQELKDNPPINQINQSNDLQFQEISNQVLSTTQEQVNNFMDQEKQQVQQENQQQMELIVNQFENNHKLTNTEQDKEKNSIEQDCNQTLENLKKVENQDILDNQDNLDIIDNKDNQGNINDQLPLTNQTYIDIDSQSKKMDIEIQTVQIIYVDQQIQCEIDMEEKLVNLKQQIIESMQKQNQLYFRSEYGQQIQSLQNYSVVSFGQFYKINKDPFKLPNKIFFKIYED